MKDSELVLGGLGFFLFHGTYMRKCQTCLFFLEAKSSHASLSLSLPPSPPPSVTDYAARVFAEQFYLSLVTGNTGTSFPPSLASLPPSSSHPSSLPPSLPRSLQSAIHSK